MDEIIKRIDNLDVKDLDKLSNYINARRSILPEEPVKTFDMKGDIYTRYIDNRLVIGCRGKSTDACVIFEDFRCWFKRVYDEDFYGNFSYFEETMSHSCYIGLEPNKDNQWVGVALRQDIVKELFTVSPKRTATSGGGGIPNSSSYSRRKAKN